MPDSWTSSEFSIDSPSLLNVDHEEKTDFQLHFDLSVNDVRAVLLEILEDLSSHKHVHNWDEKLVTAPLKTLRTVVSPFLRLDFKSSMNILLNYVDVHEVRTTDGANEIWPAVSESEDIYSHLFFSNRIRNHISQSLASMRNDSPERLGSSQALQLPGKSIPFSYGRIVNVKDQPLERDRAALLLIHTFCLQLQDENNAFIKGYIERHLALRSNFKAPDRLQAFNPKETELSGNKRYKRVTFSSHIAYLILERADSSDGETYPHDRSPVCRFSPQNNGDKASDFYIFKATSSVMLTLVDPEESPLNEEEIGLIANPCALWTMLVTNGPPQFGLNFDPLQHLSPFAQFLRGITASLFIQRTNAQHILDTLTNRLEESEDDSLFDDNEFTKSGVYHWAIRVCHELTGSISMNLEYIETVLNIGINKIVKKTHAYEEVGIEYWSARMREEVNNLGRLGEEIRMLRERVQENRNALHGATALLEARLALRQSERLQTLTYLATIYLPLTTVASIYSMSVLPSSATLPSFFVVLIICFAITLLLGINLSSFQKVFASKEGLGVSWKQGVFYLISQIKSIVQVDRHLLRMKQHDLWSYKSWWLLSPVRYLLVVSILSMLIGELSLPSTLWTRFIYRNNKYVTFTWGWGSAVAHIIRLALIPVWISLVIAIFCCVVGCDIIFNFVGNILRRLKCW